MMISNHPGDSVFLSDSSGTSCACDTRAHVFCIESSYQMTDWEDIIMIKTACFTLHIPKGTYPKAEIETICHLLSSKFIKGIDESVKVSFLFYFIFIAL